MSSDDSKTRATDPPPPARTYLVDGQQRYRVDARLGGGGFGAVFKCWHEQTATWVAIKRVHVPDADADGLTREATLLGLVDSDYVSKTRATFFDEANSLLYLVSDLATEGDLRHYLQTRPSPLPVREAVELALGIARGLSALHAQDIVHRDLKPANVLIYRRDHRLLPRLSDFGLSRNEASLSLGDFASPGYSAPEQLAFERTGPESDRFSFGLLLYELLTGSPATDARELPAYAAWLAALRDRPLEPASARRPELARWPRLDSLVRELTTFDRAPRQRISSSTVVAELEDVLSRTEADAGAAAPVVPAPRSSRTRAIAVSVLTIAVLLGASALIGFWLVRIIRVRPVSPAQGTGEIASPADPRATGRASVTAQPPQPGATPAGAENGQSAKSGGTDTPTTRREPDDVGTPPDADATTPAAGAAAPGTAGAQPPPPSPPEPSPTGVASGNAQPGPLRGAPAPAPPPKPDGPDPSFNGRWTGTLNNPGGRQSLISLSVEISGPDSALIGDVRLDGDRCRGTWRAAEATALRRVWFEQTVTGSDCVRQARVSTERVLDHLNVAMYADDGPSMGSGQLVRAVEGTETIAVARPRLRPWAIGVFSEAKCFNTNGRDYDCELTVKSASEITLAKWFWASGQFYVKGGVTQKPEQVSCVLESDRRINCRAFGSNGYVAYDLTEGSDGGIRMTRADGKGFVDLRRK